jgi:hypothetical protein
VTLGLKKVQVCLAEVRRIHAGGFAYF